MSQRDEKDDKMKFQEFKVALRSYEETEKSCTTPSADEDNVLNCKLKSPVANGSTTCYSCGQPGHKSSECRSKDKKKKKGNRWCSHCKSKTHNTDACRKKDSAKTAFRVTVDNFDSVRENSLIVDTGATAHILNDKSKFLKFDEDFKPENHYSGFPKETLELKFRLRFFSFSFSHNLVPRASFPLTSGRKT